MRKKKKIPTIRLQPDSSLAKGLVMMLEHKKLREQFWRGDISLAELNQLLKDKGIKKQYEHSSAL
jgi:hypothetical protein